MTEENYLTVERRVFSTGVGNELDLPLRLEMEKGPDKFSLDWCKDYSGVKADVKFNFSKSDKGNYFFNSMEVTADISGEKLTQKFYIDSTFNSELREKYPELNTNFTVKEAVNLLCGRSVMKLHVSRKIIDDTKKFSIANSVKVIEPAWLVLDPTDKDKYGNYIVNSYKGDYLEAFERKLEEMQLKKYQNVDFRKALRRGDPNIPVLFIVGDKNYKRNIEYKARYKNFKVIDVLAEKKRQEQAKELEPEKPALQQENNKVTRARPKQSKTASSSKVTAKPSVAKNQKAGKGKVTAKAAAANKEAVKNKKTASKKNGRVSRVGG